MTPATIAPIWKRLLHSPLGWALAGSLALHAGALAGFHFLYQPQPPAPQAPRTVALVTMIAQPPTREATHKAERNIAAKPAPRKVLRKVRAPAADTDRKPPPLIKPITPDPRRAAQPVFKAPPRKPEIPLPPPLQAVAPSAPAPAEVAPVPTKATPHQLATLPAITPPSYSRTGSANTHPRYPWLSRQKGEQGRVVLRVAVDETGRVNKVTVARSSGFPRLDRAAMRAVKTWRFTPARQAGRDVAGTVKVPVRFRLNDG